MIAMVNNLVSSRNHFFHPIKIKSSTTSHSHVRIVEPAVTMLTVCENFLAAQPRLSVALVHDHIAVAQV